MRLTFALGSNPHSNILFNDMQPPNLLVSFAYKKTVNIFTYTPEYLILDSGAFTAWNSGKSVDIKAFGDWVDEVKHKGKKTVAVNLDVIPGEVGRTSTKEERAQGMKDSIANANYLRNRGIEVMEVFHQDEPLVFLDELLDRLPINGILGISPRNDVNVSEKLEWQQVVLRHLYQRFGIKNLPKTHGLAVTSMRMMKQFPYYSVDSSTWSSAMRYGTMVNDEGKMRGMEEIMPGRPNQKVFANGVNHALRKSLENYMHIERGITTLWKQRGVVWKD